MADIGSLGTIGYLSGPVDARGVYDAAAAGGHTKLFGTSYLSQYYALLEAHRARGVVVTSHGETAYDAERPGIGILNRPRPTSAGWRYHADMIRWTSARLHELEQRGAKAVIMTDAQDYWFVTLPFRRRGMRFVNSYHCAIRSLGHRRFGPHEVLKRLTSWLHLSFADPSMAVSPHILAQLRAEAGGKRRQAEWFRPHYDRETFAACSPEPMAKGDGAKDVLFAGRVEVNKGVFDMVEACRILAGRDGPMVRFHIHGEGSALEALKAAANDAGIADRFFVYGFTSGTDLAAHYAAADIVVVPTRSDFEEGLAKSVLEGVLAYRPVVTSKACPALEVVGEACVEAKLDDASDYAQCIWRLATDPALMQDKIKAATRLREAFFNPTDSYGQRLEQALESL